MHLESHKLQRVWAHCKVYRSGCQGALFFSRTILGRIFWLGRVEVRVGPRCILGVKKNYGMLKKFSGRRL